jgi:putative hydrolase of the HAD superfamily
MVGGRLALSAVVFDYGLVLSGPQEPASYAALLAITGLPVERFENLYWQDRAAYDEGKLTGLAFWQKFLAKVSVDQSSLDASRVEQLNAWDARMWTTENPLMLAWQQQLKERGLLTAILSNIGDDVLASVERSFDWIHRFDVLVWSYQLGIAKPDPAIYRHTLAQLGVTPTEALFIDDKLENIKAAQAIGMQAIQFSNIVRLREDLIALGYEALLPLPAVTLQTC